MLIVVFITTIMVYKYLSIIIYVDNLYQWFFVTFGTNIFFMVCFSIVGYVIVNCAILVFLDVYRINFIWKKEGCLITSYTSY